jgi:hypothetical protein
MSQIAGNGDMIGLSNLQISDQGFEHLATVLSTSL